MKKYHLQVGEQIVVTIGRLDAGGSVVVHIQTQVNAEAKLELKATALLRSSTALPVPDKAVHTSIGEDSEWH